MKIVFLVVGILLIVLFLGWLFLVRPGKDRKWMAFILDAALIMVSAMVLAMGFMMRSRHIADSAAAKTAQEDGAAGEDDGQPVEGVTPQRLQEGETQTTEGSEEAESSSESQGAEVSPGSLGTSGGQGAEQEPGGQEAGGTESGGSQEPEGAQESQEPANPQDSEQESSSEEEGSQGTEESQESGEGGQDSPNPDEEETSSESEDIE
ncbi:MAG: hypothetical protein HFH92_06155 [Lachnospiraceae bacterium]|uniref:hypothetical protein n=1 Tax=uncultured Acetatifactor sp. TaxID=1671927 RepID=UPI002639A104|nr:hypothetical protein [uncultured Acetatifactor sp.]MCI8788680.1 hypothetical protein [Lachnospiraceae bacterium]